MKITERPYTTVEKAIADNEYVDAMRRKRGEFEKEKLASPVSEASPTPEKKLKTSEFKKKNAQKELTSAELEKHSESVLNALRNRNFSKDKKTKTDPPQQLTEKELKMIKNIYH